VSVPRGFTAVTELHAEPLNAPGAGQNNMNTLLLCSIHHPQHQHDLLLVLTAFSSAELD